MSSYQEALFRAAHNGDVETVKKSLAAKGVNVDQGDSVGWTAMYWACVRNRADVVDALLDAGANPNLAGPEVRLGGILGMRT